MIVHFQCGPSFDKGQDDGIEIIPVSEFLQELAAETV
jgi:hypothetical protein